MYVRVIRDLENSLSDPKVGRRFLQALELRQRTFRTLRQNVLILDRLDLISTHVLLYNRKSEKPMGYIRAVSYRKCLLYETEFPISFLANQFTQYKFPIRRFLNRCVEPIQTEYLCMDPRAKLDLKGVRAIDLMVWLALEATGIPRHKIGFAGTINNIYRQDECMEKIGEKVAGLEDFSHPVIPMMHRLILIPQVRESYWIEQRKRFSVLYPDMDYGEIDFTLEDSDIAA